MPLIIPGITLQDGGESRTEEWTNKLVGKKLVGKKLGEGSDATVCHLFCSQIIIIQNILMLTALDIRKI